MLKRPNLQSLWITMSKKWVNKWIPISKAYYKLYSNQDIFLWSYLYHKIKFSKKNKIYSYVYDFSIEKSYNTIFLKIDNYNTNFSWLGHLSYLGWFFQLDSIKSYFDSPDIYLTSIGVSSVGNLLLNYFQLNIFKNLKNRTKFYTKKKNILNNFFFLDYLNDNFFNKANNFTAFPIIDRFEKLLENRVFIKSELKDKKIFDYYKLTNFFINPYTFKKNFNLNFFINSWLHKSWSQSKLNILMSIPNYYTYNLEKNSQWNMDIFFSWYVRFLMLMWNLDNFLLKNLNINSLTNIKNLLLIQRSTLKFWEKINKSILLSIKEVWFYFWSYLKYFTYESTVKIHWSNHSLKWIYLFKRLIYNSCVGLKYDMWSFLAFLKTNYYLKIKQKNLEQIIDHICSKKLFFIKFFNFTNWILVWSLRLFKIIIKWKKTFFLKKIFFLQKIFYSFMKKLIKIKKINFYYFKK